MTTIARKKTSGPCAFVREFLAMPEGFAREFALKFPILHRDLAIHDGEAYFAAPETGEVGEVSLFYFAAAHHPEFPRRPECYFSDRIREWHKILFFNKLQKSGEG